METHFKTAVLGLGLIGGSLAMALRGFMEGEVVGCDVNPQTRAMAEKNKAVTHAYATPKETVMGADLVVFCVYPDLIPTLLKECRNVLKPGAVVTDVCGIKTKVAKEMMEILPSGVDYVGGHPMAGTEYSGFSHASAELFWMTGFIVTPSPKARPESVQLVTEMAHYIGATRITQASWKEHDEVIAYTSDLMHLAAAGLCLDYHPAMNRAYTAGAFRDCTRIANMNPELWTELFLANQENVVAEMDRYMHSLDRLRTAIAEGDEATLYQLLETVTQHKQRMQNIEPELCYEPKGRQS